MNQYVYVSTNTLQPDVIYFEGFCGSASQNKSSPIAIECTNVVTYLNTPNQNSTAKNCTLSANKLCSDRNGDASTIQNAYIDRSRFNTSKPIPSIRSSTSVYIFLLSTVPLWIPILKVTNHRLLAQFCTDADGSPKLRTKANTSSLKLFLPRGDRIHIERVRAGSTTSTSNRHR